MFIRSYEDMPKVKLPLGQEVKISDSTIRDGSQMPGLVMTKKHRLKIYEYLHDLGIEKLECFLFNQRDKDVARSILDKGYEFPEVTGWARAKKEDIDLVLKMDGIKETGILMSVSDVHIFEKLGMKSREEAEKKYLDALQYAADHGLTTRCHLEDLTRADWPNYINPLVKKIIDIDPNTTIRICDTLGLGLPFPEARLPFGIPKMVQELKKLKVRNIETHIHDDYGLGVANSLAGYWYGANWSNLTFLGIGERAGNSELEKIMMFFITRVGGFEKYDPSELTAFARYMEKEVRLHVPRNKAIVGENVFAHESGIHTAGIIKCPFTYEPFPPELVGGKRKLMVGDSSGREVIKQKVEEIAQQIMHVKINVEKDDPRINKIYADIHKQYDGGRRSAISGDELKTYVEKYFIFEPVLDEVKTDE